jgi:1-acyl-sn-glycerol-3-phosphate acyltransferase
VSWPILVIVALVVVVAWAFLCRLLLANPRGDVEAGILFYAGLVYVKLLHRLRVEGREHVPEDRHAGPLIVVANHTAGVDPILVQAACPFEIRWVMANDMQLPRFEAIWKKARVISVETDGTSGMGLRKALSHLKQGGVIGLFPEGGIERPAEQILPFHGGVGLLIRRSRATVLPVVIEGTPQVDPAWASLWTPSRARVRVMAPIKYAGTGLTAAKITQDLRQRFMDWTGWPANDCANGSVSGRGDG